MKKPAVFIASTGQHVGKTTTSLGIYAGLKKRYEKVGYIKPIGQEHVLTDENIPVDKDVILFKEQFSIQDPVRLMSPVLFPRGFTRDYLDGKISEQTLQSKITSSFRSLEAANHCMLVEGTGHVGVGSIVNINNAEVAKLLNLKVVIVASGGLGSAYDAMILSKIACDHHQVPVAGVILNKVLPDKRDMIVHYINKALKRLQIPLIGCIPFDPFLADPCMGDFEQLFKTPMISGKECKYRHFQKHRLIATTARRFKQLLGFSELIITPAIREDIILATLFKHQQMLKKGQDLQCGFILTGREPPSAEIIQEVQNANVPTIYVAKSSYTAMEMITTYTAKLRFEDHRKIEEAIDIVESHIDFNLLEQRCFHH